MSTRTKSAGRLAHSSPREDIPPLKRESFRRYELKYLLPLDLQEEVRRFILPYVAHDPHCDENRKPRYTVRSVYFDTEDLRFYFEKMDGLKVRRKLRIRTYDQPSDGAPVFLEIKRKIGKTGFKERLSLRYEDVAPALDGCSPEEVLGDRPLWERTILERFRFNLKALPLSPVVLVTYEREAFVDPENDRIRVTFDENLRSLWRPSLEQVYEERGLKPFEVGNWVLELKFNDHMPGWMCRLVSAMSLRVGPYSKFCHGIDAWNDLP